MAMSTNSVYAGTVVITFFMASPKVKGAGKAPGWYNCLTVPWK